MLQTQTVDGATLGLLKDLLAMPQLSTFALVSGTKYTSHDIFHLLRALVYFTDAEKQKDPDPLKKMTWKQVKTKMQRATETYLKRNRI